eukprot:gene7990-9499_t
METSITVDAFRSQPLACGGIAADDDTAVLVVPNLQGKFGGEVEAQLAISTVGDLRHVDAALLHRTFGARQAAFLLELAAGGGDDSVLERGPPQSLLSERSFPPARTRTVVLAALRPLCEALCTRLRQDAAEHRRSPLKLSLTWRQGYGSNPRSKTAPFPAAATAALRRDAGAAVSTAEEVPEMLLKGAMALLEGAVDVPWELTRLAAETQGSQVSAGPRAASPRPQGGAASSHHPAARSGGDRSIHAMFTTFASARPSIEPAATAAAAVERPSATEARQSSGAVCGECGVWVAAGARVEHEDHHLAMRLQRYHPFYCGWHNLDGHL